MRRRHLVVAALALVTLPACGDGDGWARADCQPTRPLAAGTSTIELTSSGTTRTAALFVPDSYDGDVEFPLVFTWHGFASTAEQQLAYADFRPLADSERFLVVAPQGLGTPTRFNLETGITGPTDDVQLALDLIDRLAADLCVDETRVYSTGASNGAGMSALLACRAPERFAAIAMAALVVHPPACEQPSPAVLGMMGDADLVVPIQGGRVSCCGGWEIAPARQSMEAWAEHAACTTSDDDDVADHVELRRWHDCDGEVEVRFYVIRGGGHTWPGARERSVLGPTNQEIDASEVMWEFFAGYATGEPT